MNLNSASIPVIHKNVELNHFTNVSVVHAAVSDGSTAELHIHLSPSTRTGGSSMTNKYFLAPKQRVTAKSLTVIFEECGVQTADFVKVDVEGFEPEVIRGAEKLFAQQRIRRLFVDIHGWITIGARSTRTRCTPC